MKHRAGSTHTGLLGTFVKLQDSHIKTVSFLKPSAYATSTGSAWCSLSFVFRVESGGAPGGLSARQDLCTPRKTEQNSMLLYGNVRYSLDALLIFRVSRVCVREVPVWWGQIVCFRWTILYQILKSKKHKCIYHHYHQCLYFLKKY